MTAIVSAGIFCAAAAALPPFERSAGTAAGHQSESGCRQRRKLAYTDKEPPRELLANHSTSSKQRGCLLMRPSSVPPSNSPLAARSLHAAQDGETALALVAGPPFVRWFKTVSQSPGMEAPSLPES